MNNPSPRPDKAMQPTHQGSRRSSKPRVVALTFPPFIKLSCLIVFFVFFPFLLYSHWNSRGGETTPSSSAVHQIVSNQKISKRRLGSQGKYRVAIIIPFVGEGPEVIPPYLELFCVAAGGSASLVDFLVIHNGVLNNYYSRSSCPSNVHFISLYDTETFSEKLIRVMDLRENEITAVGPKDKLVKILSKHIIKYPYVLVEFKPALGHIFAEFLEGYTHWGYSDLDILFGDLPRWITEEELNEFDIVTYGFGDQNRLYLRGQFTFHKNNEVANQLWRSCDYLSRIDQRFASVMSGEKHLHFESAEGCYSAAILQHMDIKVKYAVKAFTDIHEKDTAYTHGLYVGFGSKKDTTVLYKAGTAADGQSLLTIPATWFEDRLAAYSNIKNPLQWEVGERERMALVERPDAKCMFWAQQKYQSRLCIDDVASTDTIFWIDGQLYKQKYETMELPGKVVTAPFFHFQEWKRYYRSTQLSGFHRLGVVNTYVLSKEGVLPIYPPAGLHDKKAILSPLGNPVSNWHGIKGNDRSQLPSRSYCLRSGPRKFPPNPPAPQCQMSTSWRDQGTVEILSYAPQWTLLDTNLEVTMALTLQIQAEQASEPEAVRGLLELLSMQLDRWQGQPTVLVIHVAGSNAEAEAQLRIKLGYGSDLSLFGLDTTLVAAIFSKSTEFVSRKALINMAIDASPTRWVMSGFEIERGIILSHDSAFFAHRIARIYQESPGYVFIVPQFGSKTEETDFIISSVIKSKNEDELQDFSVLDAERCEGEEDDDVSDIGSETFLPLNGLWWHLSESYVTGKSSASGENSLEQRALSLDEAQLSLIRLLSEGKHYDLFAMDVSPILLTDNMGPRIGMLASDIAREVEEFGGKQCYNALRLAQLATYGYNVDVLGGAFALSTPHTRKLAFAYVASNAALGASRCDGCFFFYDESHEDILEDISRDERKRPAKASLLWTQSEKTKPLERNT